MLRSVRQPLTLVSRRVVLCPVTLNFKASATQVKSNGDHLVSKRNFASYQQNNGFPSYQQGGYQNQAAQTEQATNEFSIELGDDVVVNVSQFKGFVLTHIRQYYYNKAKVRVPGKNGVTLRTYDIQALEGHLDDIELEVNRISTEVGYIDAQYVFELGKGRKVDVIMRDSVPGVRFETTNPEGVVKQITLSVEQFSLLKAFLPNIKEAIVQLKGSFAENSQTLHELDLTPTTKIRVVKFPSGFYVDLRRMIVPKEGGTAEFSKNGIAIRPDEWALINQNAQEIQSQLYQGNITYSLDLTPMRKVTFNYYQQQWYVVIREYYVDKATNTLKPGKRGINLALDDWNKLLPQIPTINQWIQAAATQANQFPKE